MNRAILGPLLFLILPIPNPQAHPTMHHILMHFALLAQVPSNISAIMGLPNEGSPIPTNEPIAQANVSIGSAAEITFEEGKFVVSGCKSRVCDESTEPTLSGGAMRNLFWYLDAATISRSNNAADGGGGGILGSLGASAGFAASSVRKASTHRESLLLRCSKNTVFAHPGEHWKFNESVHRRFARMSNSRTFEDVSRVLGDGVIRAQTIERAITIVIDLSNASRETRRSIGGSFSAGIPGVFNVGASATQRAFSSRTNESFVVEVEEHGVNRPANVANLLKTRKGKLALPEILSVVQACQKALNEPTADANVVAVVLNSPVAIDGFPLVGSAQGNFEKARNLRLRLMRWQQQFENLRQIDDRLRMYGIEIENPLLQERVENLGEKITNAESAYKDVAAASLSDKGSFQAAYSIAEEKFRECGIAAWSLLKEDVPIKIFASCIEEDNVSGRRPLKYNPRDHAMEAISSFEIKLYQPDAPRLTDISGTIEGSTKWSLIAVKSGRSVHTERPETFTLDIPALLKPYERIGSIREFNVVGPLKGEIRLPRTEVRELESGKFFEAAPESPVQLKFKAAAPRERGGERRWIYTYNSSPITVGLRCRGVAKLSDLISLCSDPVGAR